MTIALVQPSFNDFYHTPHRLSVLGLHLIQSLLEQQGHRTQLFLFAQGKKKAIPLPPELNYLKATIEEGEHGPTSFFTQYHRFGADVATMTNQLITGSFEAIFISCFAYAYADTALALVVALKKANPAIKIVIGGAGATVHPDYFLNKVDAVLAGEAEEVLPLWLANIHRRGLIKATNAGTTPPQAVLAPLTRGQYAYSFLRGCHHRCQFCSQRLTHGNTFRKANLQQMLACFDALSASHQPIYINFEDDNLLNEKDLWFNLLNYLKQHYPTATFGAENGLNYTQINEETLDALLAYGFKSFNLSLAVTKESASQQQRFFAPSQLQKLLQLINKKGASSIVYFIAGLQHSSPSSTIDTLTTLANLPTLLGISPFYAVPGLAGFKVEQLEQTAPLYFRASSLYPWTKSHTSLQLATAFRLSRSLNLLKTNPASNLAQTIMQNKKLYTLKGRQIYLVTKVDEAMVHQFFKQLDLT